MTSRRSTPAAHPISIEGNSGVYSAALGRAVAAHGWIAPGVAKVLVRSPGYEMTATVSEGLWAAWWPGETKEPTAGDIITATAYNSSGQQVGTASVHP